MKDKKTLVVGASPNESRYSHAAVALLREKNIPTLAYGLREGLISDTPIQTKLPDTNAGIHTVSLYVGQKHQPNLEEKLIALFCQFALRPAKY